MTHPIRKVVEIAIRPGKAGAFKEIATRFIEQANREPGTLSYEWYLNDTGDTCYVLEKYRDSEALLAHLANIRDLYEPILALSEIKHIVVLGEASEEVKQAHYFSPIG